MCFLPGIYYYSPLFQAKNPVYLQYNIILGSLQIFKSFFSGKFSAQFLVGICFNSMSYAFDKAHKVGYVVDRHQLHTEDFADIHQVPDIRLGEIAAAVAVAAFFQRRKIFGVTSGLDRDRFAVADKSAAMPRQTCGHYAVKHIYTARHAFD